MLQNLVLDYIAHEERAYCYNHPDVIAHTKDQVVDRATKQLLEELQTNGFELDGDMLKRGNGWLKYDADKWQYSNDAGSTWADIGSGGGEGVTDHTLLTNIGTNTHAQIDEFISSLVVFGGFGAINGTGSGSLAGSAAAAFSDSGTIFDQDWSMIGIIRFNDLSREEMFFSVYKGTGEERLSWLEFGKTADDKLVVKVNSAAILTSDVVFSADNQCLPMEIGILYDQVNSEMAFILGGKVLALTTVTTDLSSAMNKEFVLGYGLNGEVFCWSMVKGLIYPEVSQHTPIRKGLSQTPNAIFGYDMQEGAGTTLTDRVAEAKSASSNYNLTISGTWQAYNSY